MKSESIKEITAALAKAQIAFKPIKRTEKVNYFTKAGTAKKYSYAPLDEVIEATKQALSDNGLAITQSTYIQGGGTILLTLLMHTSGEWLSSELFIGKQDQEPQSEGSALTYKRRYGISAILCVASEEDDDDREITNTKIQKVAPPLREAIKLAPQLIKSETSPETKQGDEMQGDEMTTAKLLLWVTEVMAWKDAKTARSYLVNRLKIDDKRIDTEPDKVYSEIKELDKSARKKV